VDTG